MKVVALTSCELDGIFEVKRQQVVVISVILCSENVLREVS